MTLPITDIFSAIESERAQLCEIMDGENGEHYCDRTRERHP